MKENDNKMYLLRFPYSHRYLKSYTLDEKGEVDDIETTIHQDRAMHLDVNEVVEYKSWLFKEFKPEIVEEGTLTIFIPSYGDYKIMMERRLQKASNKQLASEILSRIDGGFTVGEVRARLGFCFGCGSVHIHYTDNEKEVIIEKVFNELKHGGKSFINGLTQYKWQCNESVEVIELGRRNNYTWVNKRYVIDFKYNSPLEMLTDKKIKFPRTGYKEGFVCEALFFGNTHDSIEVKDGKTIISPFKGSSFNIEI